MSNEIWKDIPGLEGYYQASSKGQVKSLERIVKNAKGQSSWITKKRSRT